MEPNTKTLRIVKKPISFTLGPYTYTRDDCGDWIRNVLNPGIGFREVLLESHEVFLCEEVVRLQERISHE